MWLHLRGGDQEDCKMWGGIGGRERGEGEWIWRRTKTFSESPKIGLLHDEIGKTSFAKQITQNIYFLFNKILDFSFYFWTFHNSNPAHRLYNQDCWSKMHSSIYPSIHHSPHCFLHFPVTNRSRTKLLKSKCTLYSVLYLVYVKCYNFAEF